MRLLLDQGVPRSAVRLLRNEGHDVVHTAECGLSTASDPSILLRAAQEDHVVVTLDADFHALVALSGARWPSVIRLRVQGLRAESLTALVRKVIAQCGKDLAGGALVSVLGARIRVRGLPIESRRPK
jgi:predicted nuclease of predicted toxin-antitoxin system